MSQLLILKSYGSGFPRCCTTLSRILSVLVASLHVLDPQSLRGYAQENNRQPMDTWKAELLLQLHCLIVSSMKILTSQMPVQQSLDDVKAQGVNWARYFSRNCLNALPGTLIQFIQREVEYLDSLARIPSFFEKNHLDYSPFSYLSSEWRCSYQSQTQYINTIRAEWYKRSIPTVTATQALPPLHASPPTHPESDTFSTLPDTHLCTYAPLP